MHIPIDDIKTHIKSKIAFDMANRILESDNFVLQEKTNHHGMDTDKTFTVEIAVLSKEEYQELLKYKEHFHTIQPYRNNF